MAKVHKDQMNYTNTYKLKVVQALDNEYFVLLVPTMNQKVGAGRINIQVIPNGLTSIKVYKTLASFENVAEDGYPKNQESPQTSQDSANWRVPESDWILHESSTTSKWLASIDTPCTGLRIYFEGTVPATPPIVYIAVE